MSKRISLFGRKRIGELLGQENADPADIKRNELLAMKLDQLSEAAVHAGDYKELPLRQIQPDPNQPRKTFTQLEALAESIKVHGILQPIVVTRAAVNGCHRIIAGERRYHAAKRAGLKAIPCILRDADDANILLLQLLENDQREGVSPLEEAAAVAYLVETLKLPKSEVARELGRDAAWVSIRLGLYQAPEVVKAVVKEGLIEDARTLHELRKLAEEKPKKAEEIIEKIRKNQLSGSYRTVIAEARKVISSTKAANQGKGKQARIQRIQRMEKMGDELLLYTGAKRPISFKLPSEVLVQFLASVSYE